MAATVTMESLGYPDEPEADITGPDGLLSALVRWSDRQGRYHGLAGLVRRLLWWQDVDTATVEAWLVELEAQGDIVRSPLVEDILSGHLQTGLVICDRSRFARFKARPTIPGSVRLAVYERDGHSCVTCGATDGLSLDHIYPYSLGGSDEVENLQTMCRPCNSRKGARI